MWKMVEMPFIFPWRTRSPVFHLFIEVKSVVAGCVKRDLDLALTHLYLVGIFLPCCFTLPSLLVGFFVLFCFFPKAGSGRS